MLAAIIRGERVVVEGCTTAAASVRCSFILLQQLQVSSSWPQQRGTEGGGKAAPEARAAADDDMVGRHLSNRR